MVFRRHKWVMHVYQQSCSSKHERDRKYARYVNNFPPIHFVRIKMILHQSLVSTSHWARSKMVEPIRKDVGEIQCNMVV